ncbi:hypothetical protein F5141DRAFT_437782 [Pisolithus sp. B1]|nr:hypothetical protein F5141DRAFT_437782 [Pisolithus sp. B1]
MQRRAFCRGNYLAWQGFRRSHIPVPFRVHLSSASSYLDAHSYLPTMDAPPLLNRVCRLQCCPSIECTFMTVYDRTQPLIPPIEWHRGNQAAFHHSIVQNLSTAPTHGVATKQTKSTRSVAAAFYLSNQRRCMTTKEGFELNTRTVKLYTIVV